MNGLGLSNVGMQRWRRGELELAGDNGGRKGKPMLACVQGSGGPIYRAGGVEVKLRRHPGKVYAAWSVSVWCVDGCSGGVERTVLGGRRGARPSGHGCVSRAGEASWSFGSETGGGFGRSRCGLPSVWEPAVYGVAEGEREGVEGER